MSGGDTDNHMYDTIDIVSAWSPFSFLSALLLIMGESNNLNLIE